MFQSLDSLKKNSDHLKKAMILGFLVTCFDLSCKMPVGLFIRELRFFNLRNCSFEGQYRYI